MITRRISRRAAVAATCALVGTTAGCTATSRPAAERAVRVETAQLTGLMKPHIPVQHSFEVASPAVITDISGLGFPRLPRCSRHQTGASARTQSTPGGIVGVVNVIGHNRMCNPPVDRGPLRLLDAHGAILATTDNRAAKTVVEGGSISYGFAWRGSWCGARAASVGMTFRHSTIAVPIHGPSPRCHDTSDAQLVDGHSGAIGSPVQSTPPQWRSLTGSLLAGHLNSHGKISGLGLRLHNPTATPIQLDPCPALYASTIAVEPDGTAVSGRDATPNCKLNRVVPASGSLTLRLPLHYPPHRHAKRMTIRVGMAGVGIVKLVDRRPSTHAVAQQKG